MFNIIFIIHIANYRTMKTATIISIKETFFKKYVYFRISKIYNLLLI